MLQEKLTSLISRSDRAMINHSQVVLKHPCLLAMSGEGPSERLAWMITNLAVSQDQLRAIVLKQPRLLSNNIEVNMAPAVLFLTEELGLSIEMVAAIIRKFPEVSCGAVDRWVELSVYCEEHTHIVLTILARCNRSPILVR